MKTRAGKPSAELGEKEIPICPKCGLMFKARNFLGLGSMYGIGNLMDRCECQRCGFSGTPLYVKVKDYATISKQFKWKSKKKK